MEMEEWGQGGKSVWWGEQGKRDGVEGGGKRERQRKEL
jgi:hypothetical protein